MRKAWRGILRVLRTVGWTVLVLTAAAAAFDASGLTARLVRREFAARLSPLGGPIDVEDIEVDWLAAVLRLEGLTIGDPGRGVHLDRIEFEWGLGSFGPSLEAVRVVGGRVRLSPQLYHGVRGLAEGVRADGAGAARRPPHIEVRKVALRLETPAGDDVALGDLSCSVLPTKGVEDVLVGVLHPPDFGNRSAPGEIFVHGRRRASGQIDVSARARGVPLSARALPDLGVLGALRALDPAGAIALDAAATIDPRTGRLSRLDARITLDKGSLVLPGLAERWTAIEGTLDASYAQEGDQDPWEPKAWHGVAQVTCRHAGQDLRGTALFGRTAREGALIEGWAAAAGLEWNRRLLELAGEARVLREVETALAPRGGADVLVATRLFEQWDPSTPVGRALEWLVDVDVQPGTSVSYRGWPRRDGRPAPGFPMPLRARRGRVVFAHRPQSPRPDRLSFDGRADHPSGWARIAYQGRSAPVDLPPFAPGRLRAEWDLLVESPSVALDERLKRALEGLAVEPGLAGLWDAYRPSGGEGAIDLHVAGRATRPMSTVALELRFRDVAAAWRELPVPVEDLKGAVRVRADGRGEIESISRFEGRTAGCERVTIRGRSRSRHAPPNGAERVESEPVLEHWRVEATALEVDGPEAAILAGEEPDLARALAAWAPSGPLDVRVERRRVRAGSPARTTVVLVPRPRFGLRPRTPPLEVDGLVGHAVFEAIDSAAGESGGRVPIASIERRVPALVARMGGVSRAVLTWDRDAEGREGGRVIAAGVDPTDPRFLAALGMRTAEGNVERAGTSTVQGRLDLELEFDHEAPPGKVRLLLRENALHGEEGFRLTDLAGTLQLRGRSLEGGNLTARWGSSTIRLDEVWVGERGGRLALDTRIAAKGIALDEEHLRQFLDDESTRALVERFGWRGQFDLEGCRLSLDGLGERNQRLELSGDVTLADVSANAGVPISIRSARGRIERLVAEGGHVRGWGRLRDLYGRVAGLEVGPGSMLVSIIDSRLNIDAVDETFERGRVQGPVRVGEMPFSVDLRPPYPFQLAVRARGIDVGRVLRGVFPSQFADRGTLHLEVALSGLLSRLLDVRGRGSLELHETRLWSIPVFRELFAQLGLDDTAVFDKMETRFQVENGTVRFEDVLVRSPLLKLVGDGRLDFDGGIESDLEVRYGLVEKLPLLTRIARVLQNSILSVAIRGDLERPRVVPRGAAALFRRPGPSDGRLLPLPPRSDLSPRF